MCFADPKAAFRNLLGAMRPSGGCGFCVAGKALGKIATG